MSTAIVLVGGGSGDVALIVCQALGRLGWRSVIAASADTGRLPGFSRYARRRVDVAADRDALARGGDEVLASVAELVDESGAGLVFPSDIHGALCAGALAPRLAEAKWYPFPRPDTIRLLNDKWRFYRFLEQNGLPTPRTWFIEKPEQARELALPLALKPFDQSGGRGIAFVRAPETRDAHLAGADPDFRLPALAQELVAGPDVDLSFLANGGELLAWAVQTRRPDGTIDFIDDERVVELGRRMAAACGYTGLAHVDMRYDGPERRAIRIIEFNPRPWASLQTADGLDDVDFVARGVELALGGGRAPQARAATGSCAGLRSIVKRAVSGGAISRCEKELLRATRRDPFPTLARGVLRLFRPGY